MSGRRGGGKKRKRTGGRNSDTVAQLQVALLATVLLAAGILIGSFIIEWRHTRLGTPPARSTFVATPSGVAPDSVPTRIRVEVLNGVGVAGAAKEMAERLRRMGFDVVYAGNAPNFDVRRSHLIDRSGRRAAAQTVADSAGIDSLEVGLNPELYLDVTVVLGADWESLFARPAPVTESGPLRRLLERFRK